MSLTRDEWMSARRRQLRADVGVLEEQLLTAGLPLPAPADPADAADAHGLLAALERRATELRLAVLDAGLVPDVAAPSAAPSGDRAMFDRAVEAEGQLTATQARLDAEQAAHARTRQELASARAAIGALSGVTADQAGEVAGQAADEGAGMSQTDAVLAVLRMAGARVPLEAHAVTEQVSRLLGRDVPAANVRTYLGRLRARGLVGHDESSGVWWLPDPDRPGLGPPALRAVPGG